MTNTTISSHINSAIDKEYVGEKKKLFLCCIDNLDFCCHK